ncbi:chloride channel CLIC-like protein 1 [Megalops cyprinoides]|uniref:chloride channel CLIC-like protein 1 n=1 Tax=Megalops cyprinoides TaxID=118141 RepID=UPI001864C9AA|nr:chloride channel CLIC-like protein 1 [Megalops cyprinoides]XP_036377193.1 chloride channel CLIC-like protein 1 [Megalops cyprinoides]
MRVTFVVCSLVLLVRGELDEDEWIDPTDMLNYDASTKTMRKPPETTSYDNVPTKRREYKQDASQTVTCPDITECNNKVSSLQRQLQEQEKKIASASRQPVFHPVFKRYLAKLLKEVQKLGLPNEAESEVHYDAEVKLSQQALAEIRKILNGDDSTRTGVLDEALSQILVNFKPHNYEAWKWRFEDTFGVELDTVIRVSACVLIIVVIICSELWSTVSWFVQFKRIFAVCFFISIVWNWFYLYKIAFAEHQTNIIKMESINEKCTGVKKIDWQDNLKEWFRSTWTLQDDPCKKYYEVLMVNPILLVPPTKAISVTITTFITEPLKHFGQGISEFLRALLKDLPVTLQIPVLLTIVLSILVFMYGSAQAAIQHAIPRPRLGGRQDPPPPVAYQPEIPQLREADPDELAGANAQPPRRQGNQEHRRAGVRQRRQNRPREGQPRVFVETLRQADQPFSEDEPDAGLREDHSEVEDDGPPTGGAAPGQGEEEEREGGQLGNENGAGDLQNNSNKNSLKSKSVSTNKKLLPQKEEKPSQTSQRRNVPEVSSEEKTSTATEEHVENIGMPVQESLHQS